MTTNKSTRPVYIGMRIKQLRIGVKVSQSELGCNINLTKSAVSLIENGKQTISIYSLIDAALYFDVTTDYLLGIDVDLI